MSKVYKIIIRKDIIENLIREKIDLGSKPEMVFKHYETEGLIPKAHSKAWGKVRVDKLYTQNTFMVW